MSILVTPLHAHFRQTHLDHVVGEMRRRGPPVLRAYFDGQVWFAREGTHRLRAAKFLGIAPILRSIPWWRSRASLERARFAANLNAHEFERVDVDMGAR